MRSSTTVIAAASLIPQLASACIDYRSEIDTFYLVNPVNNIRVKLIDNGDVRCDFWYQPYKYNTKTDRTVTFPCDGGFGSVTVATNGKWTEFIPKDGRVLRWDNQSIKEKSRFFGGGRYLDVSTRIYNC